MKRKGIAEGLASAAFARWWDKTPKLKHNEQRDEYAGRVGGKPVEVGVVGDELVNALGYKGDRIVRLARDTVGHIKYFHTEVKPEHLLLVQRALDGHDIYKERADAFVAFVVDDEGKWWRIPVKYTDTELWLSTMHRTNDKQRRRAERGLGPSLRRKK